MHLLTQFAEIHLTGAAPLLAFLSPSPTEMMVVLIIALLLYGGRLPEVAKEWGKTFSDLRRTFTGVQNDFTSAMYSEPDSSHRLEYHPDFREEVVQNDGAEDDAALSDAAPEEPTPAPIEAGQTVAADANLRGEEVDDAKLES